MKRILPVLLILPFLASCDNAPRYKITAELSSNDLDGKTVYMKPIEKTGLGLSVDSAVVKGNTFTMKGSVVDPSLYVLILDKVSVPLFLENGNIKVNADLENPKDSKVSGTGLNDLFQKYRDGSAVIESELEKAAKQYQDGGEMAEEMIEEFMNERQRLSDELTNYGINFMKENPNNLVTAYVLVVSAQNLADKDLIEIYSKFDENVKNSIFAKDLEETISSIKVIEGEKFIDLKLQKPDGTEMSISDYAGQGKYVLLDFWASWCGPCRRENPNVVAEYAKYKDKGFEIIGISLDENKDKWIQGIKDDKITWPQMSDLKGWESEAVSTYGIKGIPFTVLLDKEGNVIAKNLRGRSLSNKLGELMPD